MEDRNPGELLGRDVVLADLDFAAISPPKKLALSVLGSEHVVGRSSYPVLPKNPTSPGFLKHRFQTSCKSYMLESLVIVLIDNDGMFPGNPPFWG